MKRILAFLLLIALSICLFTGCERKLTDDTEPTQAPAVESGTDTGLTGAIEEQIATETPVDATNEPIIQPIADDTVYDATQEPVDSLQPQTNEAITGYATIENESLGFKFNYPTNWKNLPGRSTICYLQETQDGKYPARVCITVKRLAHNCDEEKAKDQLIDYLKVLASQYDAETFEVDTKNVDTSTKFMGRPGISTTYLAYDGDTEIKGYTMLTYIGKYVFVFHFLCAYDDYKGFNDAMCYMRNSAQCTLEIEE